MNPKVQYEDLGRIDYKEAWDLQTLLLKELIQKKRQKPHPSHMTQTHHLLFCEHNPVITMGKSGSTKHLVVSRQDLLRYQIDYYEINRGGDITYHGPGQITGYPIFDLDEFFTDVHRYVRCLEEVVIRTLSEFSIHGKRVEGYTGVWLDNKDERPAKKICAIGVHLSRWVTMHGFALNVNTELSHFDFIVPCGIREPGMEVTSMGRELGHVVDMNEVKEELKNNFGEVFGVEYV